MPNRNACLTALRSRDARFDGVFFTAVRTTRIYCRPSCPAMTPKDANVDFYPSAAAAQDADSPCDPAAVPVAETVRAEPLAGTVELDGILDDPDWQRPGETRHVQNDPENGCPPRHLTEFWVAYDDVALYIAVRLHDSAPDSWLPSFRSQ